MNTAVRWFVLCVCSLLGFALPARALSLVKDGPPLRTKLRMESQELFAAEKFAELDARADRMRRERSRLPEGLWELGFLYGGTTNDPEKVQDRAAQFARIARWEKAMPHSITARVLHARVLVAYAWDARGKTFSDAMTDDGKPVITDDAWKLFAERLASARKVLESDPALKQCPVYYTTMLIIAKGEGWSRADTERLFREGVALAPDFEGIHFNYSDYLQPKWYGASSKEWLQVAARMADELKERGGAGNYTRLVWARLSPARVTPDNFAKSGIDWERMKAGFLELERTAPGSEWNKNAFCYYAFAAGDKATAKRLFAALDGDYAKEIWRTREAYKKARDWAK